MAATEFFTMAFTLACILGPALGLFFLVALQITAWLDKRGFEVTLGMPSRDKQPRWKREDNHDWQ